MAEKIPRIGVGVFIFKDGKFVMGCRRGAHGEGSWSVPGGHLEYGETPEQTAAREVMEEIGVKIKNIRFGGITNDVFADEDKHYITIWMISDHDEGELVITEPDRYIGADWFDFDSLPEPLFLPWNQLLNSQFIDGIRKGANART